MQFWILYSDIFFLANTPYFNFQINFQSSHLTKKETEDISHFLEPLESTRLLVGLAWLESECHQLEKRRRKKNGQGRPSTTRRRVAALPRRRVAHPEAIGHAQSLVGRRSTLRDTTRKHGGRRNNLARFQRVFFLKLFPFLPRFWMHLGQRMTVLATRETFQLCGATLWLYRVRLFDPPVRASMAAGV